MVGVEVSVCQVKFRVAVKNVSKEFFQCACKKGTENKLHDKLCYFHDQMSLH